MWEWTAIHLHTHRCRITPSLTLSQPLTRRTVPLKASSTPVTLFIIKPVYKIQPSTPSQHPASSSFLWKHRYPRSPIQHFLMTRPSLASSCRLLFFLMAKRRRAKSQDHFEVSLLFFFAGMGRESHPPTQHRKPPWGQLLGMLLTRGSSTDGRKYTPSSPLYPSNGITCILQPVTASAAQAYIPASDPKAILKEPHGGVHPSGNAALDQAGLHLSCELEDKHGQTDLCCPTVCPVT